METTYDCFYLQYNKILIQKEKARTDCFEKIGMNELGWQIQIPVLNFTEQVWGK